MKRVGLSFCLAVFVCVALSGCEPPTGAVSGSVLIDGQPLDSGIISFTPAEVNGGEPVTSEVRQGKYELKVVAGRKNVQISAPIVVEKRPAHDGPGAEMLEFTAERLPPRFNSQTELSFDVKPGDNTKDWSVQSDPSVTGS